MAEIKVKDLSRYKKGKVYSIRSHNCPEYYVGSTCLSLADRLRKHVIQYNYYLKTTLNPVASYDIIGKGNYYIELLEEYSCNTKAELERREGHYIREAKELAVNKRIAGQSHAIFKELNRDVYLEQKKAEYERNKEKHNEYSRKYAAEHVEQCREYKRKSAAKKKLEKTTPIV